jgi:3-keto-L-gulonate-6-phosphate decarboxylase
MVEDAGILDMVTVEEPEFAAVQITAISPEQIVLHRGVQHSEVAKTVVSLTYKFATLFCNIVVVTE